MMQEIQEYFHLEIQHIYEDNLFPFHLYIYNPKTGEYTPFLFANSPLTDEKREFLTIIYEKGAEVAVPVSQKKTCLKALELKEDDLNCFRAKELHPLEMQQVKAQERIEAYEEEEEFHFLTEFNIAAESNDFTKIIKVARIYIAAFSVKVSPTVSLAAYLAENQMKVDTFTNRIVAVSYFFAKLCDIHNEKSLGDLVCAAFFAHLGHTQMEHSFSFAPFINLTDKSTKTYKKHMGLSHHLIRKSKVELSERCITIINQHHERFDGNGYPGHKSGDNIEFSALILGVVAHIFEYSDGRISGSKKSIKEVVSCLKNKTLSPGLEFQFGDKIDTIINNLINIPNLNSDSDQQQAA